MSEPLAITAYTLTSALGRGVAAHAQALRAGCSGLRRNDLRGVDLPTWIGRVDDVEAVRLPDGLANYACRSNALAWLGLQHDGFSQALARARRRYGAERIGVFLGTTASGIDRTEAAYAGRDRTDGALPADFDYRRSHNGFATADFVRRYLQLAGPAQAVLTACSSSAKAFGVAQRYLAAGLCDAAVVAGVEGLCQTTLYGFNALQLLSCRPCRPWDVRRDGLSLGEAAGFALLERGEADVYLLGCGDSSDAYHLSAPQPQGEGALLAMRRALTEACLEPEQIDYVNLHGTGTRANDASEDRALLRAFGTPPPCSATKGYTGHTLGAAGIVEALLTCQALALAWLPGTVNSDIPDGELASDIVLQGRGAPLRYALSNAFGFGGNNCALVFGRG